MVCPDRSSDHIARLVLDEVTVEVEASCPDESGPAAEIRVAENALNIVPGQQVGELPFTVRWRYCLTRRGG